MGSFRFKWGMAKVLFPSLTKTYYANTWPQKPSRPRNLAAAIPPTDAELSWIKSFRCFCRKTKRLLNEDPRDETKIFELWLMWAAVLNHLEKEISTLFQSRPGATALRNFAKASEQLNQFVEQNISPSQKAKLKKILGPTDLRMNATTWTLIEKPPETAAKPAKKSRKRGKASNYPGRKRPTAPSSVRPVSPAAPSSPSAAPAEPLFKLALFLCEECSQQWLSEAYQPFVCSNCNSHVGIENQIPLLKRDTTTHDCSNCQKKFLYPVQNQGIKMPCPLCNEPIVLGQ